MAKRPVCLFDSGIGGFTVLKKLLAHFPDERYIYFADLARVPFGDKSKEEIQTIVKEIIGWLTEFDPKLLIMACNTSSALFNYQLSAISKQIKIPIYGMIDNISHEISELNYKRISIWATKFVVEANAYKNTIQKFNPNIIVEEIPCPKLVPMIEGLNFTLEERKKIITEYLNQTSRDTELLVLGCTHYPLITEDIKILRDLNIVDPADSLIKILKESLTPARSLTDTEINLYTTAQKDKIERFSKLYLNKDIKATLVSINKIPV